MNWKNAEKKPKDGNTYHKEETIVILRSAQYYIRMSVITLPGLIDPHVHLRDPGQTQKEDFYTGTAAALAGGFTTILDMPNNAIPITTQQKLEEKMAIAKNKIVCNVGFYFGSLGDNSQEFLKVKEKVFGLKLFLNQTTGNFLLDPDRLGHIINTFPQRLPILFHAEEGNIPLVLEVIKKVPHKVHFCHISLSKELQQITAAKEQGLPVTCGVTPHHLFLTEEDVQTLGPFAIMKPSLKSKEDVAYLWQHIAEIDVIESDHAPHTTEEKLANQSKINEKFVYGVPGLETTLPLLLTASLEHKITINQIVKMCFDNPKRIFNVPTNPTTKIEVDLDQEYEIINQNLLTKCQWSPFAGRKVKGKIQRVFLQGQKVFEDGKVLIHPGSGKIITLTNV